MDPAAHALQMVVEEYRRLKSQADRAVAQIDDRALFARLDEESNSIAIVMKHVAGNLKARWTDFLTTDGEKPDRNRDAEFEDGGDTRAGVVGLWEDGWRRLFSTLDSLTPADLSRTVAIRGEAHTVPHAIVRNLSHTASHVGQIVLLAKHFAGPRWQTLSIPKRKK